MKPNDFYLNDRENLGAITVPLLAWYKKSARILPWRENTDPYRVWISEIMLQQTRVDTVIPYYERFLTALPNIKALSEASEEKLFKLWEGLGYYSRARNLQKAAQMIMSEFGGIFPSEAEKVSRLPGIGPYTAGAILSIAFSQPTPAVDGNVLRVISRLTETACDPKDDAFKAKVSDALQKIYPKEDCGDFTQSLMELGAIVCLPNGTPLCENCPLVSFCRAHRDKKELLYPPESKKPERKKQQLTVFLLRCDGLLALNKRPEKGLLSGLYELPNTEGFLSADEAAAVLAKHNIRLNSIKKGPSKTHIFTHVEWQMFSFEAECAEKGGDFVWVTAEELKKDYSLPTAFRKFLR